MSSAARAICLDASALVKLYVDEDSSDTVREFVRTEPTRYVTPLCFYEALSVLKVKHFYRKELTRAQYDDAIFSLVAWFAHISEQIKELDFMSPSVLKEAQAIAQRYNLDISDAFQILSVKEGFFSRLVGDSRTVLVTADKNLAAAARSEGLKAWYCCGEAPP